MKKKFRKVIIRFCFHSLNYNPDDKRSIIVHNHLGILLIFYTLCVRKYKSMLSMNNILSKNNICFKGKYDVSTAFETLEFFSKFQ